MTDLEIEWQSLQPRYTSRELLEIFPEAKDYLEDRLKRWNRYLKTMMRIVRKQLAWAARQKNDWFWNDVIEIFDGALLNKAQEEIRRIENFFRKEELNGEITDADIQRAKDYPLKQLIGTQKDFILCPYHQERKASCYLKKNFGFCFSCGKHFDSIQYLQDKEGLSFVETVKRLS